MPAVVASSGELGDAGTVTRHAVLVAAPDALVDGARQLAENASLELECVDAAAIETARAAHVILVDLESLREKGLDFVKLVSVGRPLDGPPIVVLGAAKSFLEDAAFQAGCDACLRQPFAPDALVTTLRELGLLSLRQAPRVPLQAEVCWASADGTQHDGTMVDVSENGLSFMAAEPVQAGSNVLLRISAQEWCISAWIRIVYANRIERMLGNSAARMGAVFLNLSEAERDAIAKLVRRTHEVAFRETRPEQKPSTILAEFETQVVSAWLAFMLRPERFGEPPPVSTLTRAELRRAVAQLAAEEAACLRGGVEDATARWHQAWIALAARLRCAVDRGFSGVASAQWQEQAPALLERLLDSLAELQRTENEWPPETRARLRRAALKAVAAGLALRDLVVTRALGLDPEVLHRLRELDGQVAPAPAVAAKRQGPRLWRGVAVMIIIIGAVASAVMLKSQRHRMFAAADYAALSTVLASAQVSIGNGPRVLLGRVANDKWAQLDLQQRRSEAERLTQALQRQGIASGMVYAGDKQLAIHIEQGNVVYVDGGRAP